MGGVACDRWEAGNERGREGRGRGRAAQNMRIRKQEDQINQRRARDRARGSIPATQEERGIPRGRGRSEQGGSRAFGVPAKHG